MSEAAPATAALLGNGAAAALTDALDWMKARRSATCIGFSGAEAESAVVLMVVGLALLRRVTEAAAATGTLLGTGAAAAAAPALAALAPPTRRRPAACVG